MSSGTQATKLKRYHAYLRLLKFSLRAGAVYDLVFAFAMVAIPTFSAELLGLRLPADPFYLWLIATFLVMLAAMYLFAAYDPRAYWGNIVVGIIGRTIGFFVMLTAAILDPTLSGLYLLAFCDLAFAILHAVSWWPIRR